MKVLIGTKNPGKVKGASTALSYFYDNFVIESLSVPSNVSEQPVNEDTYMGARNRVQNMMKYAKDNNMQADLYMAIESGIVNMYGNWMIANFAVISDNEGHQSVGMSASFPVPEKHVQNIIDTTLGTVMDELFNESDLRSSSGGIGLLTHDNMTRIDLNTQAFTMALTKFVNGKIWSDEKDEEISKNM